MFLRLSRELTTDRSRIRHLPHNMTIFHQLLNPYVHPNKKLPSAKVLFDETQSLMFAGGDTTGNTLMLSTFYLLQDRAAMERLKNELKAAWPDLDFERAPTLRELEKLPYLNGVIKEGLRMTSGVVSPLPRVVPAGGAKICGVFVPAGVSIMALAFELLFYSISFVNLSMLDALVALFQTDSTQSTVSCGATFVHNNPNIFPEPFKFKPERWIDSPDLDTWLVSFSKGPRMCLGIK
jgi:cytochrome P450